MKIEKLKTELTRENVTIYIDMDGVVADFEKLVGGLFGVPFADIPSRNAMFSKVRDHMDAGNEVWGALEKMPDADILMDYLTTFPHHEMLTSTGDDTKRAGPEKDRWMAKYYPGIKINLVMKSIIKQEFAHNKAILIDDRSKSIDPFVAAGGIGILHTSAADTIAQLKDMGL